MRLPVHAPTGANNKFVAASFGLSPLPHLCRRVTDGCNAWFFCEDDRGCYDWQTQLSVELSQCVLMAASTRPQPEPQRSDLARPLDFSSYQAGYLKGEATSSAVST